MYFLDLEDWATANGFRVRYNSCLEFMEVSKTLSKKSDPEDILCYVLLRFLIVHQSKEVVLVDEHLFIGVDYAHLNDDIKNRIKEWKNYYNKIYNELTANLKIKALKIDEAVAHGC